MCIHPVKSYLRAQTNQNGNDDVYKFDLMCRERASERWKGEGEFVGVYKTWRLMDIRKLNEWINTMSKCKEWIMCCKQNIKRTREGERESQEKFWVCSEQIMMLTFFVECILYFFTRRPLPLLAPPRQFFQFSSCMNVFWLYGLGPFLYMRVCCLVQEKKCNLMNIPVENWMWIQFGHDDGQRFSLFFSRFNRLQQWWNAFLRQFCCC